jgi:hypothetical protein
MFDSRHSGALRPLLVIAILIVATGYPVAKAQQAILFNGSGNHLIVPFDSTLALPEFTFEFWLQVRELGDPAMAGGEQTILDNRSDAGGYNVRLAGEQWPISLFSFHGPEEAYVETIGTVRQNLWTHYAITQQADAASLYIDGLLVDRRPSVIQTVPTNPIMIGEFTGYPFTSLPLLGAMDEFRIWNHPRDPDSIAAHVHAPVADTSSGLVLYYDFESYDADTLRDRSTAANDAVVVGSPELIESTAPWNFVPPTTPVGLRAYGSDGRIDLVWTSGDENTDRYQIHRGDSSDFEMDEASLIGVVDAPDTAFADEVVEQDRVYYYRLKAMDERGHTSLAGEPAASRASTPSETFLTGVHYETVWGPGEGGRDWLDRYVRQYFVPPQPPMLGEYSSRDPAVIRQHLDWMEEFGIDFLIAHWWTPRSWTAETFREYVVPEMAGSPVQFAVMIHTGRYGLGDAFGQAHADSLLADFRYLADHLFSHPNYLEIDGKKVVMLLVTELIFGDFEPAFTMVRDSMSARGFDLFLIGDEVRYRTPDDTHLGILDAVTSYRPFEVNLHKGYAVDEDFLGAFSVEAASWSSMATRNDVAFVPTVFPGCNQRAGQATDEVISRQIRAGAESTSLLEELIRVAKPLVDHDLEMILINGWNRWNQDTQIEPTIVTESTTTDVSPEGDQHTGGYSYEGYGLKALRVVRDQLAPDLAVAVEKEFPTHKRMDISVHPNPFTSASRVTVTLSRAASVSITVYDVLGRKSWAMKTTRLTPGPHEIAVRQDDLAPGVYFMVARTGNEVVTRAIVKASRP